MEERVEIEINDTPSSQNGQEGVNLTSREARSSLDLETRVSLFKAALKGDWKIARNYLKVNPSLLCAIISNEGETMLHIAAGAKRTHFVEELLKCMVPQELMRTDRLGNTALCHAAAAGAVQISKMMMAKNKNIINIRGGKDYTPLYMAALFGQHDMVRSLYLERGVQGLTEEEQIDLFFISIKSGFFDIAQKMVEKEESLASARSENDETALHLLARMPSAFAVGEQGMWRRFVNSVPGLKEPHDKSNQREAIKLVRYLWKKVLQLDDLRILNFIKRPSQLLFEAAKLGNIEFLIVLINFYPDLVRNVDEEDRSIFHIAILHRHESIFNLIHEIGSNKDIMATYEDSNDNNMLHLAAKLPGETQLNKVSGAALQMQRELLWFKEVEKTVQPSFREKKNLEGKTPRELFTEEHKDLLRKGEDWMKETATASMIVATLITTVVFAAAFTVPGNYSSDKGDKGIPILLKEKSFSVFAISNAIGLISSSTSILMFLSILTSRYTEDDFCRSLPSKLIIGHAALFISIASMLLAFFTCFYIDYHHKSSRISLIIASFALVPLILFGYSQRRLFSDVIRSTYGCGFLFQPARQKLF